LWAKARKTVEGTKNSNITQHTALQQAEEIHSVYDQIAETARKKQNEAPVRLKFWWTHDLQLIEIQCKAQKEELTKLQEAEAQKKAEAEEARIVAEKALAQKQTANTEADRIAQEKANAKAKAEAQVAKELNEAIEIANVAWDNATEIGHQVDAKLLVIADTESDYRELTHLAQNAANAWSKAIETQRVVLSKTSEVNKNSVNDKIKTAISHQEQYDQLARESLENAQEIADKEVDSIELESSRIQSEIKEKAAEAMRKSQEARLKAKSATGTLANTWNGVANNLEKTSEYWTKVLKEEEAENITLAEDYREAASISQAAADQYEETAEYEVQAVNSWFSGNNADYDHFDKTGNTAKYSAYRLEEAFAAQKKAIEAMAANRVDVADLWYKTAKHYEESAEYKRQAAKARANRNDTDFNRFDKAGDSARVSARVLEQQAEELDSPASKIELYNSEEIKAHRLEQVWIAQNKAIEAKEENQVELAALWDQAVKQYKEAAEYELQSQHSLNRNIKNIAGDTVEYSAHRLKEAATAQEKSIKAKEENQEELATLWLKTAKHYEESAEYKQQAARAKLSGNDTDFNRLDNAGNAARVSARILEQQADELEASIVQNIIKKEATTNSSKKAAEAMRKFQEARSKTKTMYGSYADAWRSTANSLEKTSKYWTKANEAEGAGKTTLAAGYKAAAEIAQRSADKYQAIAAGVVRGVMEVMNKAEIFGWEGALSLQKQADYQVKAIEAEEAGKTQLAASYRKAAAVSEKAAERHEQAAKAFDEGKESESTQLFNTGKTTQKEANAIVASIARSVKEKATEAMRKSQEARSKAKATSGVIAEVWNSVANSLEKTSEYLMEVQRSQKVGNQMLVKGYKETAEMSQRAADQRELAAQAYIAQKEKEGSSLVLAGKSLQAQADYQAQEIIAHISGKLEEAKKYCEMSEQQARCVEPFIQAAKAHAEGKINVATCWNNAGNGFYNAAVKLEKATQAEAVGKLEVARKWREAGERQARSGSNFSQAANAHAERKTDEGTSWNLAGLGFYN
ncbi:MAG TPA: hypothetical protein VJK54_03320, partial [Chthoniobacterales bacterium]|nr:hypothetical protein [Chthoniobacterales bacterium]